VRAKSAAAVFVNAASASSSSSSPSSSPSQPRPPPRLRFRQGLPEDADAIFKLVLDERMNPFGLNPERFLVAEEEDEEQGGTEEEEEGKKRKRNLVVAFGQLAELEPGTLFELRSLVTSPRFRGRGIGAEIVKGLLEKAKRRKRKENGNEEKSTEVVLTTISRRRAFYERLGFEEVAPPSTVPKQLKLEVVLGSVVAKLAAGDSIIVLRKQV
jgi:GNAT superfamily N-acetyltransferase